jgi:hypothetical protein
MIISLYVPMYRASTESRQEELNECLLRNINCTRIDKIYLVLEDVNQVHDILSHPKIQIVSPVQNKRQTFAQMFQVINDFVMGTEDPLQQVSILANADIFFEDESLEKLSVLTEEKCFALSRYDFLSDGTIVPFFQEDSQDVWIFRGHIRDIRCADYYFGIPNCDNRIAFEFFRSRYQVFNPCHDIKTFHLHNSGVRTYSQNKRISPPYLLVTPCALDQTIAEAKVTAIPKRYLMFRSSPL